jgi:hypothetical protein
LEEKAPKQPKRWRRSKTAHPREPSLDLIPKKALESRGEALDPRALAESGRLLAKRPALRPSQWNILKERRQTLPEPIHAQDTDAPVGRPAQRTRMHLVGKLARSAVKYFPLNALVRHRGEERENGRVIASGA